MKKSSLCNEGKAGVGGIGNKERKGVMGSKAPRRFGSRRERRKKKESTAD